MRNLPSAADLIAFEAEIAEIYNRGEIKAPIHLSGGNEEELIGIFQAVGDDDLVFSTWRSHYHCLLKGVPPDVLKNDIVRGRSITLNYGPPYNILTSAIVGGIIPIALGAAWAAKRRGSGERAWCFVGDMTARTGAFTEALKYACGHELPIMFVVEDNDKSVGTPTRDAWGRLRVPGHEPIVRYIYNLPWPHSGAGKWVNF